MFVVCKMLFAQIYKMLFVQIYNFLTKFNKILFKKHWGGVTYIKILEDSVSQAQLSREFKGVKGSSLCTQKGCNGHFPVAALL